MTKKEKEDQDRKITEAKGTFFKLGIIQGKKEMQEEIAKTLGLFEMFETKKEEEW